MSGAPWWIVLISTAVGAAAAIGGSMWSSWVQRRTAGRAEWFRRLQWAWTLTQSRDRSSIAAGVAMMDYLAKTADREDAVIIDGIAPLTREVGRFAADYPGRAIGAKLYDIDGASAGSHTGEEVLREDGEPADDIQACD